MQTKKLTREGNSVIPLSAPIRDRIKGNGKTKCARCVHVADACKGINKEVSIAGGYLGVVWCEGFESVAECGL